MKRGAQMMDETEASHSPRRVGAEGAIAVLWTLMAASLPLFFGGVTETGRLWRETLSCACLALWIISLICQRRLPRTPRSLAVACGIIAAIGWTSASNPSFQFQGYQSGFVALTDGRQWLPSAVDSPTGLKAMLHWTLVLALLLMLTDLCSNNRTRSHILTGILAGGLVVLSIGLGQKLADARTVLGTGRGANQPFFSTFIYPGAAGAYLNMILPGFCVAVTKKGWSRALGVAGIGGILISWLWNTSRISTFVGCVAVCGMGVIFLVENRRSLPAFSLSTGIQILRRHRVGIVASILLLILALSVFPIPPQLSKWMAYSHQLVGPNPRFAAMKVCVQIAGDSGFWGMGPGAFPIVFPFYATQSESIDTLQGFWRHAHCDYLELLIEWGWIGILPWVWTAAFIAFRAIQKAASQPRRSSARESICTVAALIILSLHSLLDSPQHNPSVLMVALFWAACAVSAPHESESKPAEEEPIRRKEARKPEPLFRKPREEPAVRLRPALFRDRKWNEPPVSKNRQ